MRNDYFLHCGNGRREQLTLPAGWKVTYFVEENPETEGDLSVHDILLRGLSAPVGSPGLAELASRARRVALVVDDNNRPTPTAELLPPLLTLLHDNGISRESVTIMVALGTHAPLNPEQLEQKVGKEIARTYRCIQHDAWAADLVPLANLQSGRTVRINPALVDADLRITVGSVLPHPMAGFGGTPKIVMPGLADFDSIKEHHIAHVADPRSRLGNLSDNPFQAECMSVTRQVGVGFCINCVYNRQNKMVEVVTGALETAFRRAVERSLAHLGFELREKADVTITSTVPHVHGTQMLKSMSAAASVTRDKGAIILFAPLVDPLPAPFTDAYKEIRAKSNNKPFPYILRTLASGESPLPGRPMDFSMALFDTFSRAQKARVVLVSQQVSAEEARLFGFDYAPTVNDAVRDLARSYPEAKVAVFPAGGLVVPMQKSD